MKKVTKTFEITTTLNIMKRLERFFALLHFNSGFGHSGLFAMSLDGDGNEKVNVASLDKRLGYEVDAIGGVGYGVEIARDNSYGGAFLDNARQSKWYTGPAANLYKDGDVSRTIPTSDWDHPKNGDVKIVEQVNVPHQDKLRRGWPPPSPRRK